LDLDTATHDMSLARTNTTPTGYYHQTNPPIQAGSEFNLGDVLSRIPLLIDSFKRWKGTSRCAQLLLDRPNTTPGEQIIKVKKFGEYALTLEESEYLFRGTSFKLELDTDRISVFKGPDDPNALPAVTDRLIAPLFQGELWIVAQYPCGVKLSKILTYFALSYILGMLVRYYPTQWTALLGGSQIRDAALPTLFASVDLIESEFPQIVHDLLEYSVAEA